MNSRSSRDGITPRPYRARKPQSRHSFLAILKKSLKFPRHAAGCGVAAKIAGSRSGNLTTEAQTAGPGQGQLAAWRCPKKWDQARERLVPTRSHARAAANRSPAQLPRNDRSGLSLFHPATGDCGSPDQTEQGHRRRLGNGGQTDRIEPVSLGESKRACVRRNIISEVKPKLPTVGCEGLSEHDLLSRQTRNVTPNTCPGANGRGVCCP